MVFCGTNFYAFPCLNLQPLFPPISSESPFGHRPPFCLNYLRAERGKTANIVPGRVNAGTVRDSGLEFNTIGCF